MVQAPLDVPTTDRGRRTRARIVERAAELMLVDGVASTSIQDVQCAARVSASQIYHYFGDKQGLIRAVIAHHGARRVDEAHLPDRLDSMDGLREWAQRVVAIQLERGFVGGCELGSLAGQLAEDGPEVREALGAAFERWEAPLRTALRAMCARGQLRPDVDVDALALALTAALQGGTLLAQVRRDPAPLRAALEVVLSHVADAAT